MCLKSCLALYLTASASQHRRSEDLGEKDVITDNNLIKFSSQLLNLKAKLPKNE